MPNPFISQITLPSGTTYDIKDQGARELIEALEGATKWLGVTTTALTDGATTNPITIGGESVTAENGNIASYGSKEFIFNGTSWQEFGDLSALGALAYKDSASATYTPAGSVSQPTFSGTEGNVSVSGTATGDISAQTFTGDEMTSSGSFTPAGDVSQPTFTGDAMTSTGKFTPAGNITMGVDATGTANYTPSGNVSAPTISVATAGATATVNSITDVGTLPSATMPTLATSVSNENLTIAWTDGSFDAGTLPTKGADQTVKTGDAAYSASAPTFSGDGVALKGTFAGTEGNINVSGTPEGTVSKPTFEGSAGTVSVKGTPEGSVSQATFTGTAFNSTGKFTPAGSVSKPDFTGTEATITVS